MKIEYIDRRTNQKELEEIYGKSSLLLLYGESFFSRVFSFFLLPIFTKIPLFSYLYGRLQKTKRSAKKVDPFIQKFQVDSSEFVEPHFASFNDFFIRKLKPEARPVVSDIKRAVLPADGRYLVFQRTRSFFYVKEEQFDLTVFLGSPAYAARYQDGSMVIARLCPSDYHRFHFPVAGHASKATLIGGDLFSVNPIALKKRLAIFWKNKRMVTEIETEHFGTLLYVEIGATCVGTIQQTYSPDSFVKKGEEKGYFEFGGSCIVLLFEKNRILFDEDLVRNSEVGFETKAHFGESLGKSQVF